MRIILYVLMVVTSGTIPGQTGVITGRVVGPDGPLAFVNTLVKGTGTGVATDMSGLFRLEGVPVGYQVVLLSLVGHRLEKGLCL